MITLVICVNCAITLGAIRLAWHLWRTQCALAWLVRKLAAYEQLLAETYSSDVRAEQLIQGYQTARRWHQQYNQRVLQLRRLQQGGTLLLLGLRLLRDRKASGHTRRKTRRLPFC